MKKDSRKKWDMSRHTLLSWSSGKDSAWALQALRQDPTVEVVGLFTVFNSKYQRASMHATRMKMLRRQAQAAGLPLETIGLPDPCTMEQSDAIMGEFVERCAKQGIEAMAYGDLFLEEVRDYRIQQLKGSGISPLFPLWGKPTRGLAGEMLRAGVEAYLSSVDLAKLPAALAGRCWDRKLLEELPEGTDPCGENGEFHTIVAAGPMFREQITVRVGEIVVQDGFAFADILPRD
jgi:uncharacterized protein (TIGR00290 family)